MDHSFSLYLRTGERERIWGLAFDPDLVLERFLEWFPDSQVHSEEHPLLARAKKNENLLKSGMELAYLPMRCDWRRTVEDAPFIWGSIADSETGPIWFRIQRGLAGFDFNDPVSSVLRSRLLAFLNSLALPDFKISTARSSGEAPAGELPFHEKTFSLALEGDADCFTFETQAVQECVTGWFPDAVVIRSELPREEIDRTSALMERLGVTEYELGMAIWNEWRLGQYACPTVELEFYDRGEVPARCRITRKELSFTFEETNRCTDFTRQKIVGFLKCITLPEIEIFDFEPFENRPFS